MPLSTGCSCKRLVDGGHDALMFWYKRILFNAQTSLEQQDEKFAFFDFDVMLVGVLPRNYFVSFL